MANILVKALQSARAGGPFSFSDNFNRAQTTYGYGPNWFQSQYWDTNVVFADFDQFAIDNAGHAVIGASPINDTDAFGRLNFALPVMYSLFRRNQFAEMKAISCNNNVNRFINGGPFVMANWGSTTVTTNGYMFAFATGTGVFPWSIDLVRIGAPSTTIAAGLGSVNAATDVCRIDARVVGANVEVRCYVNGVQQGATFIEATTAGIGFGSPGFGMAVHSRTFAAGAASTMVLDDFNCGTI